VLFNLDQTIKSQVLEFALQRHIQKRKYREYSKNIMHFCSLWLHRCLHFRNHQVSVTCLRSRR